MRSILFLLVLLSAAPARAEVEVVTTVPTLAALVREIGGRHVSVTSMSLPTQDPHFVDAKPSLALALSKARLLVVVGLDLERGWLPTLQTGARNPAILRGGDGYLDCSTYVVKKDVPAGPVDRTQGDIHGRGNPHYLYDPRAARACATAIAGRLAQLDPAHAREYLAADQQIGERIDRHLAIWASRLKPNAGRAIVTYHRSWTYLLEWTGLVSVAELEPKPGVPPSARHVAEVIRAAKAAGATVILQESYYPAKTAGLVAKQIGGTVVAPTTGPDLAASQTYVQYMDRLVQQLADALTR